MEALLAPPPTAASLAHPCVAHVLASQAFGSLPSQQTQYGCRACEQPRAVAGLGLRPATSCIRGGWDGTHSSDPSAPQPLLFKCVFHPLRQHTVVGGERGRQSWGGSKPRGPRGAVPRALLAAPPVPCPHAQAEDQFVGFRSCHPLGARAYPTALHGYRRLWCLHSQESAQGPKPPGPYPCAPGREGQTCPPSAPSYLLLTLRP